MIQCSNCGRIIMTSTKDGGYKVRSRMVIFKGDKAVALCPTCKCEVEVPILLGKVTQEVPKTKFIVNK